MDAVKPISGKREIAYDADAVTPFSADFARLAQPSVGQFGRHPWIWCTAAQAPRDIT